MSSAPAMTLFGTADANLHASMPGTGQGSTENTNVEPPPASAGMMPIGGNSRGSVPSMSQTGPTNLPIMPFSDPFNSQFNNPLKAPA